MYTENVWEFTDSIEHEIHYEGNYGARGERRAPRKTPTPEQVHRVNQLHREKKVRRLIKANFSKWDLWVTLKYPAGTRKPIDEVKKDFRNFRDRLSRRYRKNGAELKFIYRIEVGSRGGAHIHMIVNRIEGVQTDILIQDAWHLGRVNYESLYESGGFAALAEYIVKDPKPGAKEATEQLPPEDQKKVYAYNCSRNLIRPVPKQKRYRKRTVRRMIEDGIKPKKGFYVVKESVYSGINPFTGMSYLNYVEERIRKK